MLYAKNNICRMLLELWNYDRIWLLVVVKVGMERSSQVDIKKWWLYYVRSTEATQRAFPRAGILTQTRCPRVGNLTCPPSWKTKRTWRWLIRHLSIEKTSLVFLIFLPGGGTPGNSWWGCAARFSKSWPYFRPKNVISDQTSKFHTRFQTWPLGRNYVSII